MPYVIRPMRLEDVEEVGQVEHQCFTSPWPLSAYRREIRDNRLSRYIVLTWVEDEASEEPETVEAEETTDGRLSGVRRAVSQLLKPLGLAGQPSQAGRRESIVGFSGLWLMLDEGHITTICVGEHYRGRGLGALLLSNIMDQAIDIGAKRVTLEVRVSNEVAKSLYRKYGFTEEGIRRRYYSDNNEDAAIMWSDTLESPAYLQRLADLKRDALARVNAPVMVRS